jgi:hypothetical protein
MASKKQKYNPKHFIYYQGGAVDYREYDAVKKQYAT